MTSRTRITRIALFGFAAVVISTVAARVWIARFESGQYAHGAGSPSEGIAFLDDVQSNTDRVPQAEEIGFVDLEGNRVELTDYRGKKNVVLVFTRGYPGYLCLYCVTQTSRLITNYDRFQEYDAEVVVVFPGTRDDVETLIARSKERAHSEDVPFPVVLDEEFRAVDSFGIRGDLAKPATYIFDKQGELRFAYVGEKRTDRPSIQSLLGQLEMISR